MPAYRTHLVRLHRSRHAPPPPYVELDGAGSTFLVDDGKAAPGVGLVLIWRLYELPTIDPDYLRHFRHAWHHHRHLKHKAQKIVEPGATKTSEPGSNAEPAQPVSSENGNPGRPPRGGDHLCLAIAYCDRRTFEDVTTSPDEETEFDDEVNEVVDEDWRQDFWCKFAWRLERHWAVEWSETTEYASLLTDESQTGLDGSGEALEAGEEVRDDEVHLDKVERAREALRRPPVALISEGGLILVGADLPRRMLAALGALVAFPMVSADELRAALAFAGEPVPSASELSRTLSYLESSGFLSPLDEEDSAHYRRARALGRRPLKLYWSPAFILNLQARKHAESPRAVKDSPIPDVLEPWVLNTNGAPTPPSLHLLKAWNGQRSSLRERGLTTV